MKKIYTLLSAVFLTVCIFAQAPQNFSYQAVVRGENNVLISNKPVGMKISLLQGSENGSAIYVETHNSIANANGLVSIAIGGGTKDPSSTAFKSIDWSKGPYFVKTETDISGGVNYSLSSVCQLLSVPYALYAGNALPIGGENGQSITMCDGVPTWTTGGFCPGKISALNCNGVSVNGSLFNGDEVSNVSFRITYSGGNGGSYSAQSISSSNVVGLTATLQAGTFVTGNGSLTFKVSGTPSSGGNALFLLSIDGKICSVSILVQETIGIPGPNITDVENNPYKTVTIGTQTWMAENLKVSKYSDGTTIPNITDYIEWQNNTTGAWDYNNNDVSNNAKYGKVYNWYAVSKTTNGNKNVCPTGWHVPSDSEWKVLTDYLGGQSVAGGKMKEVGTTSWNSPNKEATNSSLFSALPGGFRGNLGSYSLGTIVGSGYYGYWWSSSDYGTSIAWSRSMYNYGGYVFRNYYYKNTGLSVRCLKD